MVVHVEDLGRKLLADCLDGFMALLEALSVLLETRALGLKAAEEEHLRSAITTFVGVISLILWPIT